MYCRNTGLGLALPAILKGYKLILVIPDKMSEEKLAHLRAMGIEIILTRSDVQKGDPEYYTEVAAKLVEDTPNSFLQINFLILQTIHTRNNNRTRNMGSNKSKSRCICCWRWYRWNHQRDRKIFKKSESRDRYYCR